MSRLLVLGGTQFLGRAVAEEGVRRGAEVVVLHRGEHEPPPGVRALRADRTDPDGLRAVTTDLIGVGGDSYWDVVVDTWSGDPEVVVRSSALLRERAGRYVHVSSRSVYAWPAADGADERAPVVDLPCPDAGEPADADLDYSQSKLRAELAVQAAFPGRALILRAGLLLGPRENTGRLPWWLSRLARGGEVPVPGPKDLDWQYVDVRDLAVWALDLAAAGEFGIFDAVGPPGGTTTGELLELCAEITGGTATLRWLAPAVFEAAGVQPWSDLPGWMPPGPEHAAVHRADAGRARRHGLTQRPLRDTVADTWAWMRTRDGRSVTADQPAGLPPEVESALLRL